MNKRVMTLSLIISAALIGCGQPETDFSEVSSDGARVAVRGPVPRSLEQTKLAIQARFPQLSSEAMANARLKGIVPANCPQGFDQVCLDALFLALVNTKAIKSVALKAQTTVAGNLNGVNINAYNGKASQPTLNSGFTLTNSTFATNPRTTAVRAAVGELFLANASSASVGVGAFTFLTNQTTGIGIAGGYAGASPSGWVEGFFYCYLISNNGSPVGYCDAGAVSGGW